MFFNRRGLEPSTLLRIGVVRDGRVILEYLLKRGDRFSLGSDVANTVVFEEPGFPARFTLMEWDSNSFVLNIHPQISGVMARGGEVSNLSDLMIRSGFGRPDGRVALRLDAQTRGKVRLSGLTILFQLVVDPASASPEHPPSRFRPPLFEADDHFFVASLGLFSLLGLVGGTYFWLTPVPVLDEPTEIPERFVRVMIAPPEPLEVVQPVADDPLREVAKPTAKKEPATAVVQVPAELAANSGSPDSNPSNHRRDRALENSEFLRILAESEGVSAAQELTSTQETGSHLQSALLATSTLHGKVGVEMGTFRNGDAWVDTRQHATVALIDENHRKSDRANLGPAQVRGPREDHALVKLNLATESVDAEVMKIVRQRSGAIKACYETELAKNPQLSGRVVLDLSIQNGAVSTARVSETTMGSGEFEGCVEKRARSWRFPESVSEELSIPYAFSTTD